MVSAGAIAHTSCAFFPALIDTAEGIRKKRPTVHCSFYAVQATENRNRWICRLAVYFSMHI
jgi:hypothetical protein